MHSALPSLHVRQRLISVGRLPRHPGFERRATRRPGTFGVEPVRDVFRRIVGRTESACSALLARQLFEHFAGAGLFTSANLRQDRISTIWPQLLSVGCDKDLNASTNLDVR